MKKIQNKQLPPQQVDKKKKQRQVIMYGLGVGALLGGGYLAYTMIKNRAASRRGDVIINHLPPAVKQTVEQNKSSFPLTTGAKGSLVRMLQSALLAMGGKPAEAIKATSIKPGGEPDGIFGSGTVKALLAAGLPAMVSESTFTQLVAKSKGGGASSLDSQAIADGIKAGAEKQNIFTVLNELAKIKDVAGYQEVSSHFKNVRIKGTRVSSLVNALLSVAFASNEPSKVKIRAEFERMGLVNRNGVWSLSGFGLPTNYNRQLFKLAVTRKPTLLKEGDGRFLPPVIKPKKVVGYVTGGKAGVIQVYTPQGQIVYAPEKNLTLI